MAAILTADARSFLLNGSDAAWLVQTGAVDIFSVPLTAGHANGVRVPVCRVSPGQIFTGLGAANHDEAIGLLAVRLPGTELVPIDISAGAYEPLSGDAGETPACLHGDDGLNRVQRIAALIDAWLVLLSAGMAGPAPRTFLEATPAAALAFKPEQNLYHKSAVIWTLKSTGDLLWMPSAQVLPEAPFPLTPSTWIMTQSAGQITFQVTADLIRTARLDAALAGFYRFFLVYLHANRVRQDEANRQRLALKSNADDQAFSSALDGLAAILSHTGKSSIGKTGDPLVDACQKVMEAGGFNVQLKADGVYGEDRIAHLARQANACLRQVTLAGADWWREDAGPLLAFGKDGRPVALLPAKSGGYVILDSTDGTQKRLGKDSAATLAETAFMFFRSFPHQAIGMRDLLRFGIAGARADLLRLIGFGIMGGLLGLFTPVATGLLIDTVIPDAQSDQLLQLILLLLTATIGVSAFELTRAIAMLRIDGRMGNAAQAAIIDRLLHLPAGFFRNYSAGDLAQRVFAITDILELLSNTTQSAVLGWAFGLFSYAYLFVISWKLALLATGLVTVVFIVTTTLNFKRLKIGRQLFKIQGDIASRIFQILNGIGKIRSSGSEKRVFALWADAFAQQKKLDFSARRLSNILTVFEAGFLVLTSALLFGAVAAFMPDMTTGSFVAFSTAFSQFLAATLAMTSALTAALNAIPLYERARPILETLPEVSEEQLAPGELSGAIDISCVTFRYAQDGPVILKDLSVKINPGEFIAFVGPSGSGKSTLFRLLLGFEQPESGAIYYDGEDMAGLDKGALRRQLGVVLQNGKLMPGNIFSNIVGASALTLDDAWKAALRADLADDIKAMPMGMHTVISEGAGTISGGQKQRLMIARAIVKKPRILLFDEATSALDNHAQATVARSIEGLNATRIVIAHRLSTIVKADRIFVIDSGQVVETGNYEELMANNGLFAELAKRQLL